MSVRLLTSLRQGILQDQEFLKRMKTITMMIMMIINLWLVRKLLLQQKQLNLQNLVLVTPTIIYPPTEDFHLKVPKALKVPNPLRVFPQRKVPWVQPGAADNQQLTVEQFLDQKVMMMMMIRAEDPHGHPPAGYEIKIGKWCRKFIFNCKMRDFVLD